MAARTKRFKSSDSFTNSRAALVADKDPVVYFELNPSGVSKFDFGRWLGKGFDDFVLRCASAVRLLISGGTLRTASVVSYCAGGAAYFLDFLNDRGCRREPCSIDAQVIDAYIAWLSEARGLSYTGQRNVYALTKAFLVATIRLGRLCAEPSAFPANPYPRASSMVKGATPFSQNERKQIVEALKRELVHIHGGDYDGSERMVLAVHALALCLRTGLNTASLLELSRDCLRNHPLRKNMRLLVFTKWRGHSKSHVQLPAAGEQTGLNGDGVALIKLVQKRTAELRESAEPGMRDRLWLYCKDGKGGTSEIRGLRPYDLQRAATRLVEHYRLLGDDRRPLEVNASRFRKTLENRLWRLSGGDPFAVARIMNHTPRVSDQHYLTVTADMQANHSVLAEDLVGRWRGQAGQGDLAAPLPTTAARTPVGHCRDPLFGERAPADGQPCFDFLSCFTCSSYVIVQEDEDLYRLLSFREFLARERERARSPQWFVHYDWLVRTIDGIAAMHFDDDQRERVRAMVAARPHPFWSDHRIQEAARG